MATTRTLTLRLTVDETVGDDLHYLSEVSNIEGVQRVDRLDTPTPTT